jgi:hypothetical protein
VSQASSRPVAPRFGTGRSQKGLESLMAPEGRRTSGEEPLGEQAAGRGCDAKRRKVGSVVGRDDRSLRTPIDPSSVVSEGEPSS